MTTRARKKQRTSYKDKTGVERDVMLGAMHSAADKLNAEKEINNGRLPYGLMPTTVASLALLNIVVTAQQMIQMMDRQERG